MFKTPGIRLVFVLFIPVLLLSLSYLHFFDAFLNSRIGHSIKNVYFSATSPVMNNASHLLHFPGTVKNMLTDKKRLLDENKKLRGALQTQTLEKNIWKEKAKKLELSLTFQSWLEKQDFSVNGTPADVSAVNENLWVTSLQINKGINDHVTNGNAVLAANGLAGKITETFNNTSAVMLIVHPYSFTGVRSERTREAYLLAGTGTGCVLQFVPQDADIKKGDKLVTSGLSETIPAGIPVGEVRAISRTSKGSERLIKVEPYVSFTRIEQVFVLQNKP